MIFGTLIFACSPVVFGIKVTAIKQTPDKTKDTVTGILLPCLKEIKQKRKTT